MDAASRLKISPMSPEGLVSFPPQLEGRVGIVKSPSFLVAGCEHNAEATQTGVMRSYVPSKMGLIVKAHASNALKQRVIFVPSKSGRR